MIYIIWYIFFFIFLQNNYLDTKFGLMLKYNLNKTYGMQRVKKGEHNSWGMKKGVFRSRKT